jgi:hypothetical protein
MDTTSEMSTDELERVLIGQWAVTSFLRRDIFGDRWQLRVVQVG